MPVTKAMKCDRNAKMLVVLLLCALGACLQQPVLAQGDAFLNVVVEDRVTIAPLGSFVGAPVNVPSPQIERAANGDLYISAENQNIYKSTDNGQTWAAQSIDLEPSLLAIGVSASDAVNTSQHLANFGITSGDQFTLVHQSNVRNLFVSRSADYGATWTSQQIDLPSLDPPGRTAGFTYLIAYVVRGPVMQLADGTLQFSTHIVHKDNWRSPWPPETPAGDMMIRSSDNGRTWGDPNFLRLSDPYVFETDYAIDPQDPTHIFAVTRPQRVLLPGEDGATTRALTGAPASTPWVYKNGLLMESFDSGRTFVAAAGGLLGYYEHRNSIAWTNNGVVAILSEESSKVTFTTGGMVVRLSVDNGLTWFDGGATGVAGVGDSAVTEFVLHKPKSMGGNFQAIGMSSTIELGNNTFFTAVGGFEGATTGIDKGGIVGVRWRIEGTLAP